MSVSVIITLSALFLLFTSSLSSVSAQPVFYASSGHTTATSATKAYVSGSRSNPYATAQACVDAAVATEEDGATCVLLGDGGPFYESVTVTGTGVTVRGEAGATLSGLMAVPGGGWKPLKAGSNIYVTSLPSGFPSDPQQAFVDNATMLVEARWPNASPKDMLSKAVWQTVDKGSGYGHINSAALAKTGIDWTGALATLNVAHQFYTWTRFVETYDNNGTFTYPKNLPGLASYGTMSKWPDDNMFFLSGKLEALDSPGEWFYNTTTNLLFVWMPDGSAPEDSVGLKARELCLNVTGNGHTMEGVALFGCTINVDGSQTTISDVTLSFPTFNRRVLEMDVPASHTTSTRMTGSNNRVTKLSLTDSNNHGLYMSGNNNSVTDSLILRTCWSGTLEYVPVGLYGSDNSLTHSTVAYFGNAGIVEHQFGSPVTPMPANYWEHGNEFGYNHVHHGGQIGLDTAALYTGGWTASGSHWHHNVVHDHTEKCLRGDDQSRNMTVHHNVVFNCGLPVGDPRDDGYNLILKGDGHFVYANTFFSSLRNSTSLPACPEPYKPWLKHQWPLLQHQNAHTQVFNQGMTSPVDGTSSCHKASNGPGGNRTGTVLASDLKLRNVTGFDFRPSPDSPLLNAGVVWAPFTDGFSGPAPDVGAYQAEEDLWKAGCTWSPAC